MERDASERSRDDWGSVLFVDLRNFTNLLEFYGASRIESVLDEVFREFDDVVDANEGAVDKLVGDGMLAVFRDGDGPTCERNAVRAAREMLYDRLPALEERTNLNLKVGIGLSTGELHRATVAGIDETIIGRSVNIASRLQNLCKKYDVAVLTDRETRSHIDGLEAGYRFRLLPDQRIEGIYERIDVFEVCSLAAYDEDYLEQFDAAARLYKDGAYSRALEFFVSAYSGGGPKADRILLHHFASDCFDHLDDADGLFQNADRYAEHSTTQKTQAEYLLWRLNQFVDRRDLAPAWILDVGCGSGALTETLPETFPEARFVAIDESDDQIRKARQDHAHPQIEYAVADVTEYRPEERFDVVVSNAAMHWVRRQDDAYRAIYDAMNPGGILAVHQGATGCYRELHEAANDAYRELGFEEYFRDFQFPLVYYEKDEMEALLERHGFEVLKVDTMESEQPDTLVDDFAEASLLSYKRQLSNEAEEYAFVEQYKRFAAEYDDIDTSRIYAFATRPA